MKTREWNVKAKCWLWSLVSEGCDWVESTGFYHWGLHHGSQVAQRNCDDRSHSETYQGVHVSEDNMTFPPLKESYIIMTYHYPLDDLSSDSNFYYRAMIDNSLRHVRWTWKHCASCVTYGKKYRGPFPRQCGENTKFDEDTDEDKKSCCGDLWSLIKDDPAVYLFVVNPNQQTGSQYLNTRNEYITKILICTTMLRLDSLGLCFMFFITPPNEIRKITRVSLLKELII